MKDFPVTQSTSFLNTSLIVYFLGFICQLSAQEVSFAKNNGQWHENIEFKVTTNDGAAVFLEEDLLTFAYYDKQKVAQIHDDKVHRHGAQLSSQQIDKTIKAHAFKLEFLGLDGDVTLQGLSKKKFHTNYFKGNDKTKWKGNIPNYEKVQYNSLYEGIDLLVYTNDGLLKYDYIVHPNGDVSDIQVKYKGLNDMSINGNGDLILTTSFNSVVELAPYAYQIIEGIEVPVSVSYELLNNIISFAVNGSYESEHKIIIDPNLIASTYTGSMADNWGFTAAYDQAGNVYAGGVVFDVGYPTSIGAYDITFNGSQDIGLTKFSADGTSLIWSTLLGGAGEDNPHSIIVDDNDELIVFGSTESNNFPTTTGMPFQGGSYDIYITRFSKDASAIVNSRLYGGTSNDGVNYTTLGYNYGDEFRGDLEIDSNGDIIVATITESSNLPNSNGSFQSQLLGNTDGIVIRFDNDLSTIKWMSYFGGNSDDAIYSIEVEASGTLLLSGGTLSNDLAGMTGLNTALQGGVDGFIVRMNESGTAVINGTYLGTSEYDQAFFVDTDSDGNVYVFGQTLGSYPVTPGVWSQINASQFINKLSPNLSSTIYSTVFGTPNNAFVDISPTAFLVDVCENVYAMGFGDISGMGEWGDVTAPFNINNSGFYLFVLEKDGVDAVFGSGIGDPIGGDHVDGGTSRFDPNGYVYQGVCASCAGTNDFPTTPNAYSSVNNSSYGCNMAVFKVEFELSPLNASIGYENISECVPADVDFENLTNKPFVDGQVLVWDFGDGNTVTNVENPSHTYTEIGNYDVTLVVIDSAYCNIVDSVNISLIIGVGSDTIYDSISVCENTPYTLPNGTIVTQPGEYPITISGLNCDTLLFIVVDHIDVFSNTIMDKTCDSMNLDTIVQNLVSIGGCDSNVVIIYELVFPDSIEFSAVSCNPLDTGRSIQVYSNQWGCDSTVLITTTLLPSHDTTINSLSCVAGDTGVFVNNLSNQYGCDSIVTLNIDFLPPLDTTVIYEISCFPNDSGVFIDNLIAQDGCDSIVKLIVSVYEFYIDTAVITDANCLGDNGSMLLNYVGGYAPYNISIPNVLDTTISSNSIIYALNAGSYEVTIRDDNGCERTLAFEVFKEETESLEVYPELSEIFLGEIVEFYGFPIGELIQWSPTDYLTCDTCLNTSSQPGNSITYIVQKIDQIGCITYDTVTIVVNKPDAFVPSAFTPNNDGVNDFLNVISDYIDGLELFSIYNRWGEEVFETDDINIGWDGIYQGEQQEIDVYVYILKAKMIINNEDIEVKGSVLLLR